MVPFIFHLSTYFWHFEHAQELTKLSTQVQASEKVYTASYSIYCMHGCAEIAWLCPATSLPKPLYHSKTKYFLLFIPFLAVLCGLLELHVLKYVKTIYQSALHVFSDIVTLCPFGCHSSGNVTQHLVLHLQSGISSFVKNLKIIKVLNHGFLR